MSRNTGKAEQIGLLGFILFVILCSLVSLAVTVFLYYAAIHFIVKFW
jgi:hypothetical protein